MNWKVIVFFSFFMIMTIAIFLIVKNDFTDHFGSVSKFKHPSEWGQYGDYMGGLLNPILSMLNICLLIYISVVVASNEDRRTKEARTYETERSKEAIETQKLLALNEFRHNVYTDLKNQFESVDAFPSSFNEIKKSIETLRVYLDNLRSYHSFLFEDTEFENIRKELDDTVRELYITLRSFNQGSPLVTYFNSDQTEEAKEFKKLHDLQIHLRSELITVIQYTMLGKAYKRQEYSGTKWNFIAVERS